VLTDLVAVIRALEWLPAGEHVEVATDCHATVHALNGATLNADGSRRQDLLRQYLEARARHAHVQVRYAARTERDLVAAKRLLRNVSTSVPVSPLTPARPTQARRPERPAVRATPDTPHRATKQFCFP